MLWLNQDVFLTQFELFSFYLELFCKAWYNESDSIRKNYCVEAVIV